MTGFLLVGGSTGPLGVTIEQPSRATQEAGPTCGEIAVVGPGRMPYRPPTDGLPRRTDRDGAAPRPRRETELPGVLAGRIRPWAHHVSDAVATGSGCCSCLLVLGTGRGSGPHGLGAGPGRVGLEPIGPSAGPARSVATRIASAASGCSTWKSASRAKPLSPITAPGSAPRRSGSMLARCNCSPAGSSRRDAGPRA